MREVVLGAIENGAVGEEGNPATADDIQQARFADDVEIGILLTCEGGVGQVFGGGAGADGIGMFNARSLPCLFDGFDNISGHGYGQ